MKPKVYIRADASSQIGLGHLVRCIALAHMLKTSFKIIFVCRQIPSQIIKELNDNNFELLKIERDSSFFENITKGDIVVLDGYHFDIEYQKNIKAIGCKLVSIDDLHDKEFAADLIINHVPGVKLTHYNAKPYTKFALGLNYALMRPSFLEQAKVQPTVNKKRETLFICFGGSDHKNLTEQSLLIIKPFINFSKIIVVTGPAYNSLNSLQQLIHKDKRIIHYHAIEEQQMVNALKEAHVAIVPASGILFEVLTFKIPVITGSYIDNQAVFINEMTKYKQVINSIDFSAINLTNSINYVLNATIKYDTIFDGYSGERINELFKII